MLQVPTDSIGNIYIEIMGHYFKVERTWVPGANDPVEVVPGEVVEPDTERKEENAEWQGWLWCKTSDGEGWLPEQILEYAEGSDPLVAIVMCHYSARELEIKAGVVVHRINILNGWAWVRNTQNNEEGWVPLQNLVPL